MIIEQKISAVIQAYKSLTEANKGFLSVSREHIESFRNLIDQRAMICEDIELLSQEIVREARRLFNGTTFDSSSMTDALRALPIVCPEMSDVCQQLKDALREVVESDSSVENFISRLSSEIRAEINTVRKGSQGLKGYRQVETLGSCFINKVK